MEKRTDKQRNKDKKSVCIQKKGRSDFKIKDLVIKLVRLSKEEIDKIINEKDVQHSAITHTIPIQINQKFININGVTSEDNGVTDSVFNIEMKISLDQVMIHTFEKIANIIEPKIKKNIPKTLNQFISDEWNQCKKKYKETKNILEIGLIVMAQMRGYSAWPSRIISISKKRANVFFYGTSNTGGVDVANIVPMEYCAEVIRLLLIRKTADFAKGVREAEIQQGIPDEKSVLRNVIDEIEN